MYDDIHFCGLILFVLVCRISVSHGEELSDCYRGISEGGLEGEEEDQSSCC